VKAADWLPFLSEAADCADEISTRLFRSRDLHVEEKPDRSLVTEADLAVEEALRELLARRHPDLGVFGEEHGEQPGRSDTRLLIDPIDATANYARGIPVYATLLAIESESEIIAGLVSAPALHQRWHAARGAGAHAGSRRLQISGIRKLEGAQMFHGSVGGTEGTPLCPAIVRLAERTTRQRGFGDFWQHMLLAEGTGEIAIDPIVSPWDVAALQVIVEEAGGRATDLDGERSIYTGSLVTTNGWLHETVLEALRSE
jgi:histidinol-phosphatase